VVAGDDARQAVGNQYGDLIGAWCPAVPPRTRRARRGGPCWRSVRPAAGRGRSCTGRGRRRPSPIDRRTVPDRRGTAWTSAARRIPERSFMSNLLQRPSDCFAILFRFRPLRAACGPKTTRSGGCRGEGYPVLARKGDRRIEQLNISASTSPKTRPPRWLARRPRRIRRLAATTKANAYRSDAVNPPR
jgi:hypothetical protein